LGPLALSKKQSLARLRPGSEGHKKKKRLEERKEAQEISKVSFVDSGALGAEFGAREEERGRPK